MFGRVNVDGVNVGGDRSVKRIQRLAIQMKASQDVAEAIIHEVDLKNSIILVDLPRNFQRYVDIPTACAHYIKVKFINPEKIQITRRAVDNTTYYYLTIIEFANVRKIINIDVDFASANDVKRVTVEPVNFSKQQVFYSFSANYYLDRIPVVYMENDTTLFIEKFNSSASVYLNAFIVEFY